MASDQSKLSRSITSLQEEGALGTGCSPLRAQARTLHDEDGHRTVPWWHLAQSRGQPGRGEEMRGSSSARSFLLLESHQRAGDSELCQRSWRGGVARAATGQGEELQLSS